MDGKRGQSKEVQANFLIKILGLTASSVGITVGGCDTLELKGAGLCLLVRKSCWERIRENNWIVKESKLWD